MVLMALKSNYKLFRSCSRIQNNLIHFKYYVKIYCIGLGGFESVYAILVYRATQTV